MENSKIQWTHHTFNLVWGCQRVSPGCQHCYAEALAKRYGHDVWGPASTTARRTMSAAYWTEPRKWNQIAASRQERARVFCSSMADVFEDHPTNNQERFKLVELIADTPWLDWLLLTKRPENVAHMMPVLPPNVWLGTSVENQEWADKRRPHLTVIPAAVRFVSYEPALGPVDWTGWEFLDWLIVGGESGPGARPFNMDWVYDTLRWCYTSGVEPFVKQVGSRPIWRGQDVSLADSKGGDMDEWPSDFRVRRFPVTGVV